VAKLIKSFELFEESLMESVKSVKEMAELMAQLGDDDFILRGAL
jgi:hypothetical protein